MKEVTELCSAGQPENPCRGTSNNLFVFPSSVELLSPSGSWSQHAKAGAALSSGCVFVHPQGAGSLVLDEACVKTRLRSSPPPSFRLRERNGKNYLLGVWCSWKQAVPCLLMFVPRSPLLLRLSCC